MRVSVWVSLCLCVCVCVSVWVCVDFHKYMNFINKNIRLSTEYSERSIVFWIEQFLKTLVDSYMPLFSGKVFHETQSSEQILFIPAILKRISHMVSFSIYIVFMIKRLILKNRPRSGPTGFWTEPVNLK